jgi:glycine cleavage system H protein
VNPEQLLYAKTHEWVRVEEAEGGKTATVGLSAHAIEALTDLVYLELPEPGTAVRAGEPFGEVESVKAVSDIYSPVDGEVVESNRPITERLERLAEDPYGDGWLVRIRVADESGLAALLDYAAYQRHVREEGD